MTARHVIATKAISSLIQLVSLPGILKTEGPSLPSSQPEQALMLLLAEAQNNCLPEVGIIRLHLLTPCLQNVCGLQNGAVGDVQKDPTWYLLTQRSHR